MGILAILSVLLAGCTGRDEGFGKDLLPKGDLLYSFIDTDTVSISAFTVREDRVLVSNPSSLIFGSFNDPLLGRTDAGFAAQFRLLADLEFVKDSDIVDSVILVMTYKEIYGDTLNPQTVNVYELKEPLNYYANYFSPHRNYDLKGMSDTSSVLGTTTFVPKFRVNYTVQDSVEFVSDTTKQVIRIKLGNELGNDLVQADPGIYKSNDNFLNFFKGLYIEPEPVDHKGTLMKLFPTESRVFIYSHNIDDSESRVRWIAVTKNSAIVPRFTHNFDNSAYSVDMPEDTVPSGLDSLIFIKPNAGTRIKVMVPSLDKWAEEDSSGCLINKALITFHVDTLVSDLRRFTNPQSLYLKRIGDVNDDGIKIEDILEDAKLGISYYGGVYDAENATYSFNIAQHLQGIIKGEIVNEGFYLVHATRKNSFGRVILKGPLSSQPVKLEISYSRYSN